MMQQSAARYDIFIILASVFLMIAGIVLIFTAIALIKWFVMPHLSFWDPMFLVAPYLILGLGIYILIISLYGCAITSSENQGFLIFYAVLLLIAFIVQVASIYVWFNVKVQINIGCCRKNPFEQLNYYGETGNESITNSWDYMQEHFQCCGLRSYQTGYNTWHNTKYGQTTNGVPDSCCKRKIKGCGENIFSATHQAKRDRIFVDGCLGILNKWMQDDVHPIIVAYFAVGFTIALVEFIAAVLAFAYAAQISRRSRREDKMGNSVHADYRTHEMTSMNDTN